MIARGMVLLASAAALGFCSGGAEAQPEPPRLAAHRAVYDLSLVSSRGIRAVEGAQGRIAYELTGNACEGYAVKFRQVTVLDSPESGSRTSDLRTASFESGDGKSYRFRNDSSGQGPSKTIDGSAERRPGSVLSIKLNTPRRQSVSLGDAVFPNAQMKDIIAAAREGKTSLQMRVFDGSDDGRKVYETLAVIGREEKPGGEGLEAPARQDALSKLSRWPVVLSYYASGRADAAPVYVLSFDLFENGVSRALKLDYGDFVLKGDLVSLDLYPEKGSCAR